MITAGAVGENRVAPHRTCDFRKQSEYGLIKCLYTYTHPAHIDCKRAVAHICRVLMVNANKEVSQKREATGTKTIANLG